MLYESNTFQFSDPVKALRWLEQIGLSNIGALRDVSIFVEGVVGDSTRLQWYGVLRELGRKATRLKALDVYFDQEGIHRSSGYDEEIVLALAGIRSLDKLEVGGFYSSDWLRLLKGRIGVSIMEF